LIEVLNTGKGYLHGKQVTRKMTHSPAVGTAHIMTLTGTTSLGICKWFKKHGKGQNKNIPAAAKNMIRTSKGLNGC
jgi:hypothetical protein